MMRLRKGSETILVVDDNPAILELVVAMLLPLGYRVLDAPSAKDALRLVERQGERIDLLLTDVVMPGMQGVELADIFGARYPATKVLFMSGYLSPAITPGEYGQQKDFVQKPVSSLELTSKIRMLLD